MSTHWGARLFREALQDKRLVTIVALVTVVGVAVDLVFPLVTKAALDSATGDSARAASLGALAAVLVALASVRFLSAYLRRYSAGRLSLNVQNSLRIRILQTVMALDGPSQDAMITGQIVARSISDLQIVQGLLAMMPLSLGSAIQVVLAFAVMAYLSPILTLVALAVIPAIAIVVATNRRALFAATWSAQQAAADIAQHVEETVTGVRVVKGFGQEDRAVDDISRIGRRLFALRMRAGKINARFTPTMSAIPALSLVVVIAVGGYLTARGHITVGTFVAFTTYVTTMTGIARLLTNLIVTAQLARAAVQRVLDVIDHPTDPRAQSVSDTPPTHHPTGIVIDDADFTFADGTGVFSHLDLRVAPGETIAIVGPPGSGKSTLAALLSGVYHPTRGAIDLLDADGTRTTIADIDRDTVHRRVQAVTDDPFLYSDSIAANIALGTRTRAEHDDPDIRARIVAAARAAAADEFIADLPEGYDTVVGERGLTLSGGQRQRIALARALFADAPLIVLDDATSAVDATTEAAILHNLATQSDRTLVLLAHRRSTLLLADRVAVIDDGRVIDQGTVTELTQRSPLFNRLMSAQPAADNTDSAARLDTDLWPDMPVSQAPAVLGVVTATDELLDAVQKLPPADEDPRIDDSSARSEQRRFTLRATLAPVVWLLGAVGIALAIDTGVNLLFPTLARIGIDAAVRDHLQTLAWVCVAGCGAVAVGWIAGAALTLFSTRAGERVLFTLRVRSFAHLQRLGLDFYERELSGRIMTRMTTDIDALSTFLQTGLSTAVVAVLTVVGVAIALVITDPSLAGLVLTSLIPLALATIAFQRISSRSYSRSRELISAVNADFQENVTGVRTTVMYRNTSSAVTRFTSRTNDYVRARLVSQRAISAYFPFISFVSDLATATVIGVGAHQVAIGQVGPGTLVAFILYLGMLFSPIQQLSQVFDGYQQAVIGLRRIGGLLDTTSSVEDGAVVDPAAPAMSFSNDVHLDHVRFRYSESDRDALSAIDMTIPAGTSLALVGRTGAGKSTIVKLLARFYDPTTGAVRVDGTDIRHHTLTDYRHTLGVVPQEAHLFTGTVGSNIAYGRPDASHADIVEAAHAVGAIEIIATLRGAMNHPVGERGQGLSAGQRQLIALARAELVQPKLLLLDEATATLDQATERAVLDASRRVTRIRTSVIVAHRLATAASADRIAVVDDGAIIEVGTHDELLALHGRYRQLWDSGATADDVAPTHAR